MGARSLIAVRWFGPFSRPRRYISPPTPPIEFTPIGPSALESMFEESRLYFERCFWMAARVPDLSTLITRIDV